MRPPDLPGGNPYEVGRALSIIIGFNEAAGFTRRKHVHAAVLAVAGRASMRPPDLPGGNPSHSPVPDRRR